MFHVKQQGTRLSHARRATVAPVDRAKKRHCPLILMMTSGRVEGAPVALRFLMILSFSRSRVDPEEWVRLSKLPRGESEFHVKQRHTPQPRLRPPPGSPDRRRHAVP